MTRQEAPEGLELVRNFVNTLDMESGLDELETTESTRSWLNEHKLVVDGVITEADVLRLKEAREALRSLLLTRHDSRPAHEALALLNRFSSSARLVPVFGTNGSLELIPERTGVEGVIGRLLAEVYRSSVNGTWGRLKVCSNDECRWAFYDHSKNHSGKWCSMQVCGNRMKARSYRQRHQVEQGMGQR